MESDEHDVSYKFILLGDAGVGKTNILSRFILDDFSIETPSTISMEFGRKIVEIDGKKIKLQLWDTAGQEKYRSVTKSYIKGSRGALLVYDISKAESFHHVDSWYNDIKECGDKDCIIELLGNKSDLEESREVSIEEGKNKALELNTLFNEISALRGDNIEEAFNALIKVIISSSEKDTPKDQKEEAKENNTKKISLEQNQENVADVGNTPKKKKKCC